MNKKIEIYELNPQKADWKDYMIDLSNPVQPPEPIIIQTDTGIPMLHRRNISTISASAKVGKTFLVSAIATALLNEDSFLNLHCPKEKAKVIFVDTEQDKSDTQEVAKRIHKCNGWGTDKNNIDFIALNLRENPIDERLKIIESAIESFRPDLVLLDGIVDLVPNFNDIEDSKNGVETLTRWSTQYDCHVMTCLHVNKGTNELRGHLGAFLRQKGELTLLLSKQDGALPYIEVKPVDTRHMPIEPFCFRINNQSLPELYEPEPSKTKTEKLKYIFDKILLQSEVVSNTDLVKRVMQEAKVKTRTAQTKIKEATDEGFIIKNKAGQYHLPIQKNVQEEVPF